MPHQEEHASLEDDDGDDDDGGCTFTSESAENGEADAEEEQEHPEGAERRELVNLEVGGRPNEETNHRLN